jgi:hypothetical protein
MAAVCAAPAVAVAGLAVAAGPADATVGPYEREQIAWGDCTIVLGTVPDAYLRAFGGTDVACGHTWSNITIKTDLWRYDAGRWSVVATSGWRTAYNTSRSSVVTGPYSVPGCRYWDVTTTVNVGGYQVFHDYVQDVHNMKWNPTVGNC